jgi:cell division protein DivIC
MQLLTLVPSWLKNKYVLALVFFAAWMIFFDHNDIFQQMRRSKELNELEVRKSYYQEQIKQTKKEVDGLRLNASSLEKVAREKYLMKKDNEDLFVIPE